MLIDMLIDLLNCLHTALLIRYIGMEDDQKIQMAFTKKQVDARKDWLTQGMLERRERREAGQTCCGVTDFVTQ